MIAAVLESGDLRRLYTALGLLVSAAVEGTPVRVLVMFGALEPLLDEDLLSRARDTPGVDPEQGEAFARSLVELRDTALTLPDCRVWACSAAVELTGADSGAVERRLAGITSTPQFLREVGDARLIVV